MSKYRFKVSERVALWRTYNHKCFWCGEPIDYQATTIDHVLPESLLNEPERLKKLMIEYGLAEDFSINDYCNWVPAHMHCNREKGSTVYPGTPAFLRAITMAQEMGERARAEAERYEANLKKSEILADLGIAFESGVVKLADLAEVIQSAQVKTTFYEPIVVTFGMGSEQLAEQLLAYPDLQYPQMCDQLEQILIRDLSTRISSSFFYPEASHRTGESLSVRLAFVGLDFNELESAQLPEWEIIEIEYYSEVYGHSDWTTPRYDKNLGKAPVIADREFMELLHRGGLLTSFEHVEQRDYRAVAISQDLQLYKSDSFYDLNMWTEILELAGIENWEIQEAMAKTKRNN